MGDGLWDHKTVNPEEFTVINYTEHISYAFKETLLKTCIYLLIFSCRYGVLFDIFHLQETASNY